MCYLHFLNKINRKTIINYKKLILIILIIKINIYKLTIYKK